MSNTKLTLTHLTPRELEVLTLMAKSMHNDEIAKLLAVSPHTAKFHVNSVLTKTHQTTRLGAVIACIKLGYIDIKNLQINDPVTLNAIAKSNGEVNSDDRNDHTRENILEDIMESVDKLSMDFNNEDLRKEIKETLETYLP